MPRQVRRKRGQTVPRIRTRPTAFQEAPGEAEADAARDAFLKSAGPGVARQAAALGRADAGLRTRAVSRLQQERGNAYVQRVVAEARGSAGQGGAIATGNRGSRGAVPALFPTRYMPVLQRFEAPEHIDIGQSGASVKVKLKNGLELTYGEISALVGDFYGTPERLDNADPAEVQKLLKIAQSQRQAGGKIESKDVEFQKATQWREKTVYDAAGKEQGKEGQYRGGKLAGTAAEMETKSFFGLAQENAVHFAPDNLKKGWDAGHKQALDLARQSFAALGKGEAAKAADLQRLAWLTDAGTAHFLEDAFAAGHLLEPTTIETWMTTQWTSNPNFKEKALGRLKQAAHKQIWYAPNATIDKRLDALLRSIPADTVAKAGLKVLHDYLNENGIEAINKRGDRWQTYGDYNLSKSPATQKYAGEAISLAKQQVTDALAGKTPNPDDVLKLPPDKVMIPGQAAAVPIGSDVANLLKPVLESRLVGTDDLWNLLQVAKETQEKAITPFEKADLAATVSAEKKRRDVAHGGVAGKLIKGRTNWIGALDEAGLAKDILGQPDTLVETVLDQLASNDRDDVALEYMQQTPQDPAETALQKHSLHLLLRLQAELLTGSVGADERKQAYRIASLLELQRDAKKAVGAGKKGYSTRDMQVAILTATGDPGKAVDEATALVPVRVLDATQAAAKSLIEKHTSWGNLAEDKLARDLKGQPPAVIIEALDQLEDSDDDDDVALEYMKTISAAKGEPDLRKENEAVLRRLRQALRSGSVAKDEEAQALRIDSVLGVP